MFFGANTKFVCAKKVFGAKSATVKTPMWGALRALTQIPPLAFSLSLSFEFAFDLNLLFEFAFVNLS